MIRPDRCLFVARATWLAALFVVANGGCRHGGVAGAAGEAPAAVQGVPPAAPVVVSNVLRSDYAGSEACRPCHAEVYATWLRSPMHRMTRLPAADVRAPFDGSEFRFKDDVARLDTVGGERFMNLRAPVGPDRTYRVTRVIGGRYREDFAGVEVASMAPGAASVGDPHAELILPVSYVFQTASFRLKGYSVMVGERPGLRAGGVWNQTCVFCHNTVPYFDDLWGALHGPGAPGYQGEVVDRTLPERARLRYAITDAGALTRALDTELLALGAGAGAASRAAAAEAAAPARAALRRAMLESRTRFGARNFVELGIGCEACHGGARAHVDEPHRLPSFAPRAPFLTASPATGDGSVSRAEWQNRACARCHQVLFSRYARTWEGGERRQLETAGGSSITSGEARDFLLGGCARELTCTACHDPHGEDSREHLERLATPAGNGVCTSCHRQLATEASLRAHAHHQPGGAGGSCVACHMPRKNMGLGYALTRYHRIGSPTDPQRVEHDRPLECALCHADKSVRALVDDMARLWGKRYDTSALVRLYGSLDANVLVATIERGYAHEQAAAMGAAGDHRWRAAAAATAREATGNAYPLVRLYAAAAGAAIEGRPFDSTSMSAASAAPRAQARPGAVPPARSRGHDVDRDDDED